jgi:Na+/melibiose symporter-like transporter
LRREEVEKRRGREGRKRKDKNSPHLIRHEGVLYSIFLLGGKIGSAVALSLSSYTLGLTGYKSGSQDPNAEVIQNDATLLAFRIMIFLAPLGMMFLVCVITLFIKDYKKVCFVC